MQPDERCACLNPPAKRQSPPILSQLLPIDNLHNQHFFPTSSFSELS